MLYYDINILIYMLWLCRQIAEGRHVVKDPEKELNQKQLLEITASNRDPDLNRINITTTVRLQTDILYRRQSLEKKYNSVNL